jgi:hypothetical protein
VIFERDSRAARSGSGADWIDSQASGSPSSGPRECGAASSGRSPSTAARRPPRQVRAPRRGPPVRQRRRPCPVAQPVPISASTPASPTAGAGGIPDHPILLRVEGRNGRGPVALRQLDDGVELGDVDSNWAVALVARSVQVLTGTPVCCWTYWLTTAFTVRIAPIRGSAIRPNPLQSGPAPDPCVMTPSASPRSSQDRNLVPQHEELNVLGGGRATQQKDQPEHLPEDQVQEPQRHARIMPGQRSSLVSDPARVMEPRTPSWRSTTRCPRTTSHKP